MNEEQIKATPGPWEATFSISWEVVVGALKRIIARTSGINNNTRADAAFIAHARADVPALIAEVRSLRAKLDAANVEWQEEHAARLVLGEQLKLAEAKAMFWWNEATHPNVEVQP